VEVQNWVIYFGRVNRAKNRGGAMECERSQHGMWHVGHGAATKLP